MDLGQESAASEKAPPPSPFVAFRTRDFRFYAAARLLATVGVQMQGLAVAYQVYALTRTPLYLGFVGLAQFIPVIGLSLVVGQVADRFDRRRILLLCNLVFACCALALYAISESAHPSLPAILTICVMVGAGRAFYGPAGSSLMPALVPKEHLTNAISWQSTFWQVAAIGGPALGGFIYGARDAAGPVYLTSAVVLGIAGFGITRIETRPAPVARHPITMTTALAGLRYVRKNKLLLGSISLDFFAVFLGGAVAMLPIYATDVLGVGPSGLGLLRAAPSVGAGLTALWLAFHPLRGRAGAKMLAGVAIFGVATIVFGLSTSFPLSLIALAALGSADMVSMVVRMTLEQLATPQEMRGRVSAVNQVFVGASNELGEFESGTAAALFGVVPSVVLGGLGTLVVVGIWTALFPEIRTIDKLEDVAPKE